MQKTQEGAERVRVIINVEAEQGRQCKRKRCRETQIKCERVEGKRVRLNLKYVPLPREVAITTSRPETHLFVLQDK